MALLADGQDLTDLGEIILSIHVKSEYFPFCVALTT